MLSVSNANIILRDVYLNVLADQINFQTNAFYNKIQMGSGNLQGSKAVVPVRFGINGGISCPSESSDLPEAYNNQYTRFNAEMRNIYGAIELSDKIIRATSSPDAMVNVLNTEMEGLLKAAKFNFARMLFQDGSGKLCTVGDLTDATLNNIPVDSVKNIIEGMIVDIVDSSNGVIKVSKLPIKSVNRSEKIVRVEGMSSSNDMAEGDYITIQDSYNTEILGLPYIFNEELQIIYGTVRNNNHYLWPTFKTGQLSTDLMQETIDDIEESGGGGIDLIICSYDVRRAYFEHLKDTRTNVDYMNLDGGFKALSYNGVPVVTEKFAPDNTMYFVNTEDFTMQQLSDWSWLEGAGGKILRQVNNKAAYTATLVKYANLICKRPIGQGMLTLTS